MDRIKFTDKQKEKLRGWSQELHTTDKQQGNGRLRFINRRDPNVPTEVFCCLGIYGMMRKPNNWKYNETYMEWELQVNKRSLPVFSVLPPSLSVELGLNKEIYINDTNYNVSEDKYLESFIISLNDTAHWSFEEIACEVDHLVETGQITQEALDAIGWELLDYAPNIFNRNRF